MAVQQKWWALQYIQNPSEDVQLAAARKNGWSIQYIQNPSIAVQLAAVQQEWLIIKCIKNPSRTFQLSAFARFGFKAVGHWSSGFRPTAFDLKQAFQESNAAFKITQTPRKKDLKIVLSCLKKQPAADILDLAAVAPKLFDPPELRKVLRDALLVQAGPTKRPGHTRSM